MRPLAAIAALLLQACSPEADIGKSAEADAAASGNASPDGIGIGTANGA